MPDPNKIFMSPKVKFDPNNNNNILGMFYLTIYRNANAQPSPQSFLTYQKIYQQLSLDETLDLAILETHINSVDFSYNTLFSFLILLKNEKDDTEKGWIKWIEDAKKNGLFTFLDQTLVVSNNTSFAERVLRTGVMPEFLECFPELKNKLEKAEHFLPQRSILSPNTSKQKDSFFTPKIDIKTRDVAGNTPLHLAVIAGKSFSKIESLLKTGADVNAQNLEGNTALHLAFFATATFTADSLLKDPNINVNLKNSEGNTPLHLALATDDAPRWIIELLLEKGADLDIQNLDGIAPRLLL